ncbi:FAD:protein FMN transferase [Nonomuraea sp. NPDC050790]|uniref:FAD:protein FMN transferase n=1 Tax=Nonomuraea sp. NPDC050790 TaxID=3364371 RepID=UPI0037B39D7C
MSKRVEHVMGMPVCVEIRTPLPERELVGLLDASFAWLRRVDETFSTYRQDSQISRLARGERRTPGPDVEEVLARCAELREETGGYFSARAGGTLDPSGYVKGWAVERLSRALTSAGALSHCVNAGGDIRVRGSAAPGRPWRIGIRHPRADSVCKILFAHDLGVATSGAYERGTHILDPHTGRPAHGLASVTVTGPDLALADAYATAIFAAGRPAFPLPAGYELLLIDETGAATSTAGLSARAA